VWTVEGRGRGRTRWVAPDGTPLAGQPIEGPVWAEGRCLWQWVEEPVDVPVWDAPPEGEHPDPATADGTRTVWRGVLRELVDDARVVVIEAPEPGVVRAVAHELRVEASVGPYLFLTERLTVDAWGAHPSARARALVWDLRTAAPADPLTERERESLVAEARARARRRLVAEGADRGVEAALPAEAIELVALRPRWSVAEGLRLELRFATQTCYACGDGRWSDYTRSVRVTADRLPERLARHARIPAWVRSTAHRLEDAEVAGFTIVEEPGPVRVLDSLRR
jgi:hypothetical protein